MVREVEAWKHEVSIYEINWEKYLRAFPNKKVSDNIDK